MSDEPREHFKQLVEAAFTAAFDGLVRHFETEWVFSEADIERIEEGTFADADMSSEEARGWNKCCASIRGAVEFYLQEFY